MDFGNAFILWRGLGIDYEGGVLDAPARVAIHYTHRLGAYVTTLVLLLVVAGACGAGSAAPRAHPASRRGRDRLQVAIGMNLIWKGWPLSLGTAHNAGAALLVLATVALLRSLTPALGGRPLPAVAALGDLQRYWINTGRPATTRARHTAKTRSIEEEHGISRCVGREVTRSHCSDKPLNIDFIVQ